MNNDLVNKRGWPTNIHSIRGNNTRIDPTDNIYPLYTTNPITQSPDILNNTVVPITKLNNVIAAKEDVDSLHL